MQNRIVRQGIGSDVFPSGTFIANLALELARRMIRNGERIPLLIEEVKERFKDIKDSDIYALLSELQKLGFDVTPNEWLYLTPVEYRAAALKKLNILKNAKIYGSRYEDILAAIKETKEELKQCIAWLEENEDAKRLNPQTYYSHYDYKINLEKKYDDLQKALHLSKAAKLYDRTYMGGTSPLYPINLVIDDKVSFILFDNKKQLIKSAAEDLQTKSTLEDYEEEVSIPLVRAFEKLGDMEALKPFWADFRNNYGEIYDDPERISEAINDLLEYIDRVKEEKDLSPKQINEAYKIIEDFVEQQEKKGIKLNTNVKQYVDFGMETTEDDEPIEGSTESEIPEHGIGESSTSEVGGNPPKTEGQLAVTTSDKSKIVIGSFDKEIAKSLQYIDKINSILSSVRVSSNIPKTIHVDKAIDSLQSSLKDIKNYIERELPYNSEIERKAARTVLSNIMKKLSVLVDLYTDNSGSDELMKYIVSSDFLKTIKSAKILLVTIGE